MTLRNIPEENYKIRSTFSIFPKSSCKDFLVSRALINFMSKVISQTEMLRNCSEDPLSTDREYVMQLLKASSVPRDEIVDSHRGDLGRSRYHVKKEKQKLHQHLMSQKNQL